MLKGSMPFIQTPIISRKAKPRMGWPFQVPVTKTTLI